MSRGWRYTYGNHGAYATPAEDGLTDWHPAFLRLAPTLVAARGAVAR